MGAACSTALGQDTQTLSSVVKRMDQVERGLEQVKQTEAKLVAEFESLRATLSEFTSEVQDTLEPIQRKLSVTSGWGR